MGGKHAWGSACLSGAVAAAGVSALLLAPMHHTNSAGMLGRLFGGLAVVLLAVAMSLFVSAARRKALLAIDNPYQQPTYVGGQVRIVPTYVEVTNPQLRGWFRRKHHYSRSRAEGVHARLTFWNPETGERINAPLRGRWTDISQDVASQPVPKVNIYSNDAPSILDVVTTIDGQSGMFGIDDFSREDWTRHPLGNGPVCVEIAVVGQDCKGSRCYSLQLTTQGVNLVDPNWHPPKQK